MEKERPDPLNFKPFTLIKGNRFEATQTSLLDVFVNIECAQTTKDFKMCMLEQFNDRDVQC